MRQGRTLPSISKKTIIARNNEMSFTKPMKEGFCLFVLTGFATALHSGGKAAAWTPIEGVHAL